MTSPVHPIPSEVSLTENLGEWHVAVREDGREDVRSFDCEEYALSYAEGQKHRLGLNAVVRV